MSIRERFAGFVAPHLGLLVLAACVVVGPSLVSDQYRLYVFTIGLTYTLAAIGTNLAFGYAGVFTMGAAAFALLGAYTVGILETRTGLPTPVMFALVILLCASVGLLTSIPVLRLGAWAVAVMTLMYAPALVALILYFPDLTGGGSGLYAGQSLLTVSQLWYLIGAVVVVVWWLSRNLVKSPLGRAWLLSKRSRDLAQTMAVSVTGVQATAFVLAACTAGVAGGFQPVINGFTDPSTYELAFAIMVVAMVVVGGEGTLMGPVVGAVLLTGVTLVVDERFAAGGHVSEIVYGSLLLFVALMLPRGIVGTATQAFGRVTGRSARTVSDPVFNGVASPNLEEHSVSTRRAIQEAVQSIAPVGDDDEAPDLRVDEVAVAIGGVQAVDGVSLVVRAGTVHGIIGPNGAGKTTLLNAISGFRTNQGGSVLWAGRPLSGSVATRARRGIARTFQLPTLLDNVSALENVLAGTDAHRRVSYVEYALRLPRSWREAREARRLAMVWLSAVGLERVAEIDAGSLSTGQKRQLEVARALAMHPKLILMDEPAAGLSATEVVELVQLMRAVADAGIAIVLIEHHAEMVRAVSDWITVLDAGRVISEGPPETVVNDPVVIAAYLGNELDDDYADDQSSRTMTTPPLAEDAQQ